ncbi:unnamed protein product [Adineta ricciae]|uniref:Uncharacterized protein n=1 Tax=Adineta ricciae TaxID=249248 RepID=A0A813S6R3_ADIRI|nr:unnamed protein product [Adineta ricciae]CAF0791851.1 unnamed protein product [Adineta ricciae]
MNIQFSRVALQPGEKRSAQLAYFNHEENLQQAIHTLFQDKTFDVPSPKLIITLEGGSQTSGERSNDFNEKQFSASVAKLLLDIGQNKLNDQNGTPWLFTSVRYDPVAGRIIQIAKQQYLAHDIPLSNFVNIGIDVCESTSVNSGLHDYRSIVHAIRSTNVDLIPDGCSNSNRIVNKRLSHLILYGKSNEDPIDRYAILQQCIDEINQRHEKSTNDKLSISKMILLYGGDTNHIEPLHRLMNVQSQNKKFSLIIIRGSGGLADILAWIFEKIRNGGLMYVYNSNRKSLTSMFLRELKVLVEQLLCSDITNDLIMLTNYLTSTRCEKVCVCDENDDLSLYFLEALIAENQTERLSSLKLHLSLAFDLNQPKFASRILRYNQDLPEEDVIQLAKMAIIRDQVEFFHVLEDVCGVTSDNLGENFDRELSSKMNYNHALFLEYIQQDFGCDLDEMYQPIGESSEHTEDEIHSINVKLFLWAIFFDHYNLSLHFWKRLNDRLCAALVAALVYRQTADLCVKRSSTESITVEKLRKHADDYENLAIRLLQSLYTSNPDMARLAIKRENYEFNKFSSLEIAIMSNSENFVGHTCVQEVFDIVWLGKSNDNSKKKSFDRILTGATSSFGQATKSIAVTDYKNVLKYFLTIKHHLSRPQVKYHLHFLFYLIFLSLLSYLVLFVKIPLLQVDEACLETQCFKQSWSMLQIIINIWIFMFALEEFRQAKALKTKENGIRQTFIVYLSESWNKLDALCVTLYVVSIVLECFNTKLTLNAARAFLAIDVVLWFIRLLILLMIDRTVGPMLLMIQAMLSDMVTFFSIFFVFTSAYGVASFALLKSGQLSLDLTLFRKIFHQAYWHVYGEINDLDDIKDNFELTGWAAFVLLAFYMAISNILLVNLLVAMFSNTFDRMFAKMDTLWKFNRYYVIKEYTILSPLPPPLNLFHTKNHHLKPFNPELSQEQMITLQRREALAYASDLFEHETKEKQTDIDHREKIDSRLHQLRKMLTRVKVTCEAAGQDVEV